MNMAYTGSLALQDMNGMSLTVTVFCEHGDTGNLRRPAVYEVHSGHDGRDAADIIAGTAQPKPVTRGITHPPDSPSLRRGLSIMAAAFDMYPLSCNIPNSKNRTAIIGIKERTLPTPGHIPFIMRSLNAGLISAFRRAVFRSCLMRESPEASASLSHLPRVLKVRSKIISIIKAKIR